MPRVITRRLATQDGTSQGAFAFLRKNITSGLQEAIDVAIPSNLTVTARRPNFTTFDARRIYTARMWNKVMAFTEDYQLKEAGLPRPFNAPVLAASAGAGTLNGEAVVHYTFAEYIDDILVVESDPSDNSNTVTLTNKNRVSSGFNTSCPNNRATHIRIYCSMDGGDFRFVERWLLGITTVEENVPTSSLGSPTSFERGVPPASPLVCYYNGRMYYVDPAKPYRTLISESGEPEAVSGSLFRDTLGREAITALARQGNDMVVFCRECTDVLTDFGGGDIKIRRASPSIGCGSFASCRNINERLWFWSPRHGVVVYNGAFHCVMTRTHKDYHRQDYQANRAAYDDCFGEDDRKTHVYKLCIPKGKRLVAAPDMHDVITAFAYACHYETFDPAIEGGGHVEIVYDTEEREESAIGNMTHPTTGDVELYMGFTDGYIRQQNVEDDVDDDGDTRGKTLALRWPHYFMGDQSGDDAHGRQYTDIDLFMKNPSNSVIVALYGGDDEAFEGSRIAHTIPASALTVANREAVAKTSHHLDLREVSGKGLTVGLAVAGAAADFEIRGLAIHHKEGAQQRNWGQ